MRTRRRVGAALVGLAVLFALPVIPALAADAPVPATNPDLAASCGTDISLVLDRSGSIGSNNTKVQQAAQTFVDALVGTGSRVQLVSFSTTATAEPGGGASLASLAFHNPASLDIPTFPSNGTTNWDDALEMVRRSPAGQAPLVVMITDGDPTRRNEDTPNGHGGDVAGDSSVEQADLDQAVTEANLIKGANSHMFVVGVGSALSNATSENRIKALSGPDKLTFTGETANIGFGQADYTLVAEFAALKTMVSRFVRELCAPSLNVVKLLQRADGTEVQAGASDSFTFNASLSPTPSSWVSPAQAPGAAAVLTTTNGVANFDWEPATLLAPTTVTLSEQPAPGWVYNGIRCWLSDLDGSAAQLVVNDVGTNAVGASKPTTPRVLPAIGAYQAMNCEVLNRQVRAAVVSVDKVTQPGGLSDAFSFSLRQNGSTIGTLNGITDASPATAFAAVAPGTYDVVEAPSAHFTAASTCDNLLTGGVEKAAATGLSLGEAARWQCTFTNTLHDGTVRVVKDLDGAPAGTFSFTSNIPGHAAFSLQPTAGTNASTTFTVAPGTYAISEVAPAPFAMVASCSGQSDPAHVIVRPDEQTTCTFTNTAPAPTISVSKSAVTDVVSEPGGPVAFNVTVTNQSVEPLTIDAMTDTVGGNTIDVFELGGAGNTCGTLEGAVLQPGQSLGCTFTIPVQGNAGASVTDTVEVTAVDGDDNKAVDDAKATVRVVDVAPTITVGKSTTTPFISEPGGLVTYDVSVTNTSGETVTLTSLTDRIDGGPALSLQAVAGPITQTICALVPIPAGATYTCNFTAAVTGDAGVSVTDEVTAVAVDDDGTQATAADDAVVQLTDVLPSISVEKSAGSASVPEPGGPVTFTVDITNDTAEPVRIDAITDAVDGGSAVAAGGTCAALIGTTLAGHAHVSCTFTLPVLADATHGPVTDVVVVTASDDDDHTTTGAAGASVAITDVKPTISVSKTAGSASVPEPGAEVVFTVEVTNTSVEPVTIDSILDSVDGGAPIDVSTLPGTCADLVGDSLAPSTSASCTFELLVAGTPEADVEDVVTVSAGDDDGNQATGADGASVAIDDLLPSIGVTKLASVASLPEPGGAVTYTVTVSNQSIEPVTLDALSDVVGDDPSIDVTTIAGTTCVLPQSLAIDDDYSCTFTLPVSGDAGETVTDVVTATAHDDEDNDATATATASVGLTDVLPTIEVTKDSVTGTLTAPGGAATFEVTVVNTSPESVTIDEITDEIDGDVLDVTDVGAPVSATTCETGVVLGAAGEEDDTYDCAFTLELDQTEPGQIDDLVRVVGHDNEDNEATADDDASTTVTAVADLAIDKVATEVPVVGQTGEYTLTVTNAGPSTAELLVLTDQLPDGLTATAAAGDGWACAITPNGRTVTCVRASLASGATSAVVVTVAVGQPGAGGTFTNVATVGSPTPDPDLTDNTDSVTLSPVVVLGEVITPVVADARGSLPATGSTVRPWLVAAAVSLLAGLWFLHGELSLLAHGRRGVPAVRSNRTRL